MDVAEGDDLDWSQGVPLAYQRELLSYWKDGYDWKRVESELNNLGLYKTYIDRLTIQFIHVRSSRTDAHPLIITHGWPGSVVEILDVIKELTEPSEAGAPAFHVVAPSMPGFGFSDRPAEAGWGPERIADAWCVLMERLGYRAFLAQGGDWGAAVTTELAIRHPAQVKAIHVTSPWSGLGPKGGWTKLVQTMDLEVLPHEQRWLEETWEFWGPGSAYAFVQGKQPQSIGYGLVDSPSGQLAWIIDKFHAWTDCSGHPENAISRARMLDNVSLYWLTGTAASAGRIYWHNRPENRIEKIAVPTAITVFPFDIEKVPRSWLDARYSDLRLYSLAEKGGHFSSLEVPQLFLSEVRRAFAPDSPLMK
ncbi:epoxide hydrolase (plasmid) [Rhizobium sp. RCAM05350]|uniref:epoxide hydrolase family protein n=1 Tax=Rhizobium sp. RCAM05350 TaxID=2895568 RepID=UPI002076B318|nr:epoxide hydrolase family protein [Rhizobium sp. RCAM05350]URK89396.1 epoxide hydrolase [Rhizobium sp. RCAM05350]